MEICLASLSRSSGKAATNWKTLKRRSAFGSRSCLAVYETSGLTPADVGDRKAPSSHGIGSGSWWTRSWGKSRRGGRGKRAGEKRRAPENAVAPPRKAPNPKPERVVLLHTSDGVGITRRTAIQLVRKARQVLHNWDDDRDDQELFRLSMAYLKKKQDRQGRKKKRGKPHPWIGFLQVNAGPYPGITVRRMGGAYGWQQRQGPCPVCRSARCSKRRWTHDLVIKDSAGTLMRVDIWAFPSRYKAYQGEPLGRPYVQGRRHPAVAFQPFVREGSSRTPL